MKKPIGFALILSAIVIVLAVFNLLPNIIQTLSSDKNIFYKIGLVLINFILIGLAYFMIRQGVKRTKTKQETK